MCESMIALLRCKNNVSSSDVKSYIENFDGLMYKMQNNNAGDVPESSLNLNRNKLEKLSYFFNDQGA